MAESRLVSVVSFLTLCTLVSAAAQTTQGAGQFRLVDATGSNCSAVEPENGLTNAPGCAINLSSLPPQLSPSPNTEEQRQIAARFVNEKLEVWQKRLKLEDWHISVVMTRRSDLKPKTLGGIRWDKRKKSAVMGVQDAADYRLPFREMLADMEFTVVHELVHLELASLPRSEASRSSEEHAVNQIAEALLKLDSQK